MDPDGSLFTHSILAVQAASPTSLAASIGLFLLFLALCAFFALCETAITEYSESRLEKQAEDGDRHAALFLQLAEQYSSLTTKVRTGFVLSVMACEGMLLFGPAQTLAAMLVEVGMRRGAAVSLSLALTILIRLRIGSDCRLPDSAAFSLARPQPNRWQHRRTAATGHPAGDAAECFLQPDFQWRTAADEH